MELRGISHENLVAKLIQEVKKFATLSGILLINPTSLEDINLDVEQLYDEILRRLKACDEEDCEPTLCIACDTILDGSKKHIYCRLRKAYICETCLENIRPIKCQHCMEKCIKAKRKNNGKNI